MRARVIKSAPVKDEVNAVQTDLTENASQTANDFVAQFTRMGAHLWYSIGVIARIGGTTYRLIGFLRKSQMDSAKATVFANLTERTATTENHTL
jgi:hypothetical protein